MTMSSSVTELLRAAISQYYSVGEIHSLEPVHHPTLNAEPNTRIWKVDTVTGLYCFKCHRVGKTTERAVLEEEIQLALAVSNGTKFGADASDFVLSLIRTSANETGILVNEQRWWLESYKESIEYSWWEGGWDERFCNEAGQRLAAFHLRGLNLANTASSQEHSAQSSEFNLTPAQLTVLGPPIGSEVFDTLADAANKYFYGFRARANAENDSAQVERLPYYWVEFRRLTVRSQSICKARDLPLTKTLIHGDFHPGNLLGIKSDNLSIIDFEHTRLDDPAFDIAYALIMFCTPWSASAYQSDETFERAFLSGYQQIAPHLVPGAEALKYYEGISYYLVAMWLLEELCKSDASSALTRSTEKVFKLWDVWSSC